MKAIALISALLVFGQGLRADKYTCEFQGIFFKSIDDGGIIDLPGHTWAEDEKRTMILDTDDRRVFQWEIEFSERNPRLHSRKVFVSLENQPTIFQGPYIFTFYLADAGSEKTIQRNWIYYKQTLPDSILFEATNTVSDGYFEFSIDCTRAD